MQPDLSGIESSLAIVAVAAMFVTVGLLFLFVNLLVGKFVRPHDPHPEKQEIYECGEPTIGSSFVQFDLRFYVVALLFIIFDVEVAFFFPWATLFGKTTNLSQAPAAQVAYEDKGEVVLSDATVGVYRELGFRDFTTNEAGQVLAPTEPSASLKHIKGTKVQRAQKIATQGALQLAWFTLIDICVFFAVLLVGFAYVWKRGDLDWVRAVSLERAQRADEGSDAQAVQDQAISV